MEREEFNKLIERAKLGDDESFERLVDIASPLIASLVRRYLYLDNKLEYEDLYNIALFALYKAIIVYDSRNPSFLHIAKKIIARELADELKFNNRKKRKTEEVEIYYDIPYEGESVEEKILKKQAVDLIYSEIEKLKPLNEKVFKMYLEGYTSKEIAEELNSTSAKVSSSIYRSKKKIKNNIGDKFLDIF